MYKRQAGRNFPVFQSGSRVQKHNLPLVFLQNTKRRVQYHLVRGVLNLGTKFPQLPVRKFIQTQLRLPSLVTESHVAEIPGNGKHPRQGFPLRPITGGGGPHLQIGLLHQLLRVLRTAGDGQKIAVNGLIRILIKLSKGFLVARGHQLLSLIHI